MEINKYMTSVEQIGHVFEYTSKYVAYVSSVVKNESDFVLLIIDDTYKKIKQDLYGVWDSYSLEYWVNHIYITSIKCIYNALDQEDFSFDFCEISEDVVDFDANLKRDRKDFDYNDNVSYEKQKKQLNERLGLLSSKQRLALILFYVFDCEIFEIAKLYNVNEIKMKSILADSRKKLNVSIPFFRWVLSSQLSKQEPCKFLLYDECSNTCYKTGVGVYRPE